MKKLLSMILVIFSLLGGNAYAEIVNLKCKILEQKFSDGTNCSNCAEDDGLTFDLENNKVLYSPFWKDKVTDVINQKFSEYEITWGEKNGIYFQFNRYTQNLNYTWGRSINNYKFIIKYKCNQVNKI